MRKIVRLCYTQWLMYPWKICFLSLCVVNSDYFSRLCVHELQRFDCVPSSLRQVVFFSLSVELYMGRMLFGSDTWHPFLVVYPYAKHGPSMLWFDTTHAHVVLGVRIYNQKRMSRVWPNEHAPHIESYTQEKKTTWRRPEGTRSKRCNSWTRRREK